MKTLPARSVDCFICDLPYGQLANKDASKVKNEWWYSAGQHRGCPWDVKLNLEKFWEQVRRLCKDDHTPVLMFCNTKFGNELINSNPDWFRYDLVWNKQRGVSFLSANKMPMKSHEMIYIFSKKGAYYKRVDIDDASRTTAHSNYNKPVENTTHKGNVYISDNSNTLKEKDLTRGKGCPPGKRCALSVLDFKKVGTCKDLHPTEKPVELYKWLLERYCPAGGTVLDPTAGSFNAVFAAKQLGLKGIGIEKDRDFFWKGIARLEKIERSIKSKSETPPTNTIELN